MEFKTVSLGHTVVENTGANHVTKLRAAASRTDPGSHARVYEAIYQELHRMAEKQMADERSGLTLQTTALIHEVYIKLSANNGDVFATRGKFFSAAANAMRQILIDDARRRKRLKRGGGQRPVSLDGLVPSFDEDPTRLVALHEALTKLAEEQPRKARVVELRFFSGLRFEDIAETLGISRRAAQFDWDSARAWLHRELAANDVIDKE